MVTCKNQEILSQITIFRSYYAAGMSLKKDKDRLSYYDAILKYAFDGEVTKESDIREAAWGCYLLAIPNIKNSREKSIAGAKGGSSKKVKGSETDESKMRASDNQSSTDKDKDLDKDLDKPSSSLASEGESAFNNPFDDFWQSYPNKKSKALAEKEWKRLRPNDELIKNIMVSLKIAKTSYEWLKEGGQFIPYPDKWLRNRGWENEYTTKMPTAKKSFMNYEQHVRNYDAIDKLSFERMKAKVDGVAQ